MGLAEAVEKSEGWEVFFAEVVGGGDSAIARFAFIKRDPDTGEINRRYEIHLPLRGDLVDQKIAKLKEKLAHAERIVQSEFSASLDEVISWDDDCKQWANRR